MRVIIWQEIYRQYCTTDRPTDGGTRIRPTSDEQGRSCPRLTAGMPAGLGRRSVKTLPLEYRETGGRPFVVLPPSPWVAWRYCWARASRRIDTRRKRRISAYVCGHDDFRTRSHEVNDLSRPEPHSMPTVEVCLYPDTYPAGLMCANALITRDKHRRALCGAGRDNTPLLY